MMRMHVSEFIARVRDLYPESYKQMSGGCLKFHLMLKSMYPQAEAYYNNDHVVTEIDQHYYDIDGEVLDMKGYLPMRRWSKSQLITQFSGIDSAFIKGWLGGLK